MPVLVNRLLRPQAISNSVLVVALIALAVTFASRTPNFLTVSNLLVLANNAAALGVIVVPFTLLVISGNVDFSVGSTAGLAGTLAAVGITQWGLSEGAGIGLALVTAAAVGVVNGVLCVLLGFNPIIVTLGMLGAIRGGTLLLQQDQIYGIGTLIERLGSEAPLGVPMTLWVTVVTFILGALFLVVTPWGRHVYAIGVNPQAAFLSALPVRALPFVLYVVTSLCAGISGIVFAARLNGVSPAATGQGMEFQALTIVLLGGVAFAGGRGSLFGVLIAWLFLASLQNGLVLTNVTPYIQTASAGLALVLAAALDRLGTTAIPRVQARLAASRRKKQLEAVPAPLHDVTRLAQDERIL